MLVLKPALVSTGPQHHEDVQQESNGMPNELFRAGGRRGEGRTGLREGGAEQAQEGEEMAAETATVS